MFMRGDHRRSIKRESAKSNHCIARATWVVPQQERERDRETHTEIETETSTETGSQGERQTQTDRQASKEKKNHGREEGHFPEA